MKLAAALATLLIAGTVAAQDRPTAAAMQDRPALQGTVRDRQDGRPIARVLVEVLGTTRHAWSDSLGLYELPLLDPGPRRIRLSRLGYRPVDLEAVLPHAGVMRLDVGMLPRPVALSEVRLESASESRPPPPADPRAFPRPFTGARTSSPGDRHLGSPAGEPDALWAASAAPEVTLRPDLPTALHVRGGSADQNLVLLDGVPVLSPHHSGGVLTAISPDALAGATLHAGVPPAAIGGAVSSAIELRTLDVPRRGLGSRGGVGMRGARASLAHALPWASGGVLVAGRRSYRPGFPGGDGENGGEFGDLLLKGTLDLPGGGLDVLSFASRDRLGFASAVDPEDVGTAPPNSFDWGSRALGVVWRGGVAAGGNAEMRAWRSGFDATVDWAAEAGRVRLRSARSQIGVAARVDAPVAGGWGSAGAGLERHRVRYALTGAGVPEPVAHEAVSAAGSLPGHDASLPVVSGFLEQAWSPGERWSVRVGMRGLAAPSLGFLPEPRLSLSFAPSDEVLVSVGYARASQLVQSLRNEESILDAVTGTDLPVLAGSSGVPVARSDQLAADVAAVLWEGATLELQAYTRRLDGLVLVGPSTSEPFALRDFTVGTGRASGAAVMLEHRAPRVTARAALAAGTVTRRSGGLSYSPSFERPRSLSASVEWLASDRTRLRGGLLAASGSPTTPFEASFEWEPSNAVGGEGEIEGSPRRALGPLNGARLPVYVRLDLGLRREIGLFRDGATLAAHVDVLNVLDRANVVGYGVDPETTARRPLTLLGRSLALGLEWSY